MTNILDQAAIASLHRVHPAAHKAGSSKPKKVVPFDLRLVNRMSADQVGAVTTLHASFARRMTDSLGAYLRVALDFRLVSAEQLVYREFTAGLPELSYCASLHVMPIDARVAIQSDLALVYPIIDALLGGTGANAMDVRDLTEIEERMFETIVGLIVQDLRSSWASVLQLDFTFEQRQRGPQVQNIISSEDRVLCLRFEARMTETSGSLAMVFPAVIANALLRRLAEGNYSSRLPSRESRRRVRERLLNSRFMIDLSLPTSPLTIRQLIELEPGKVLLLPRRTQEPVHFNIARKPMFLAFPVRQGTRRGARIEKRTSIAAQGIDKQD